MNRGICVIDSRSIHRAIHGLILLGLAMIPAGCGGLGSESGTSSVGFHVDVADIVATKEALGAAQPGGSDRRATGDGFSFRATVTASDIGTPITSETFLSFDAADAGLFTGYIEVPGVPNGTGRILNVKVVEVLAGEEFQFIQGYYSGIALNPGSATTVTFPFSAQYCVPATDVFISATSAGTTNTHDLGLKSGVTIFAAAGANKFEIIYDNQTIVDTSTLPSEGVGTWITYSGNSSTMTVKVTNPTSTFWLYEFVCAL